MKNLPAINKQNLPATVEGLRDFILIGDEALKAHKAKLRAIRKADMAQAAEEAALQDGLSAGEALIAARARLGELIPKTVKPRGKADLGTRGRTKTLPPGITKRDSHRAQEIARHPEVVRKVIERAREKREIPTSNEVIREISRERAKANIKEIQAQVPSSMAAKKYDVVVIDPPWPMKKIERDVREKQAEFDYPTLDIWCRQPEEGRACWIAECGEGEEPISCNSIECVIGRVLSESLKDSAHIFLWTTHRFLPAAINLIEAWNLKYVCLFTWHKPGGFQPINLPQYNCEFAIYARKGTPKFASTKNFSVCFEAPRGKHSEKPERFYDMLRAATVGARLDMFNRREIEGFVGWGNEA